VRTHTRPHAVRESGQALVEFSLAFIVFVVLLMAIFDFGRGIYMFNGVSQAAREIARATSVAPGIVSCVDIAGAGSTNNPCQPGDYVKVTVTATYTPVSLLGLTGPIVLTSSSSVQIPRGTP
jgi:hypothetical protein